MVHEPGVGNASTDGVTQGLKDERSVDVLAHCEADAAA